MDDTLDILALLESSWTVTDDPLDISALLVSFWTVKGDTLDISAFMVSSWTVKGDTLDILAFMVSSWTVIDDTRGMLAILVSSWTAASDEMALSASHSFQDSAFSSERGTTEERLSLYESSTKDDSFKSNGSESLSYFSTKDFCHLHMDKTILRLLLCLL